MGHVVWKAFLCMLMTGAIASCVDAYEWSRGSNASNTNRSCSKRVSSMCKEVCVPGARCEVRAAVVLPSSEAFDVSLPLVQAALSAALRNSVLPANYSITLLPNDDHCESYAGALSVAAFAADCAHVFFGPFCEYSLASVARLVKFYGTPLITTGGMSMDFMTDKTTCANEYHMLVRVGTMSFFSMSEFLISVMDKYGWKKVMMVYEKNGYSRVAGEHTCHLFMQSLVGELKKKKFLYSAYDMDKNPDVPVKENLRREMQLTYSSKSNPK